MTPVASFDDILLHDPTNGPAGGALLYLVAPPRRYSGIRRLGSQVEVEVAATVPVVVLRGLGSSSYEETLEGALRRRRRRWTSYAFEATSIFVWPTRIRATLPGGPRPEAPRLSSGQATR